MDRHSGVYVIDKDKRRRKGRAFKATNDQTKAMAMGHPCSLSMLRCFNMGELRRAVPDLAEENGLQEVTLHATIDESINKGYYLPLSVALAKAVRLGRVVAVKEKKPKGEKPPKGENVVGIR